MSNIIVDTGPLVAFLSGSDSQHEATVAEFRQLLPPFFTYEPVITEAAYLLRRIRHGTDSLLQMLDSGLLVIRFQLFSEHKQVGRLMTKYSNIPISLADACLVRMSEQIDEPLVFTLDRDFRVYRRNGRQIIPLIAPER